jgi:nucleotide-binding universal stress UspA family protein/amino acid transporter
MTTVSSSEAGMDTHRPRSLDWKRASGLLYGDWGTSKAYVIGLAFAAMGFGSFPVVLAVCALCVLVGLNYIVVCRCFPDGGGVYSAARPHGRSLAVIGALLLLADFTVTAALSGWAALSYLGVPPSLIPIASVGVVLLIGCLNIFGPHHSGSFALGLALPVVISVAAIVLLSIPSLSFQGLEWPHEGILPNWVAFTGVILALSGVEAIANLSGVLKPDKGSPPGKPRVGGNAAKAILPVMLEVSLGTALLAWAVLSLPHELKPEIFERKDDVLRFTAEHYAGAFFGPAVGGAFGWFVGIAFALLLLSAVNTALAALVGLMYAMAKDGEMPQSFLRLNRHGVPIIPLVAAVGLPVLVLLISPGLEALAGLYAIGVVGAIALNLGSCAFNRDLRISLPSRLLMGATFLLLAAVEFTLAQTKPHALFFVTCVLIGGFALRAWSLRHKGVTTVTVPRRVATMLESLDMEKLRPKISEGGRLLLCLRGVTPVLTFAIELARSRNATLYLLYVREVAVAFSGPSPGQRDRWQDDPEAALIMKTALDLAGQAGIQVVPVYAVAPSAGPAIVDVAATLGVDELFLGASGRSALAHLLRGSVVDQVVRGLPEEIGLVIRG